MSALLLLSEQDAQSPHALKLSEGQISKTRSIGADLLSAEKSRPVLTTVAQLMPLLILATTFVASLWQLPRAMIPWLAPHLGAMGAVVVTLVATAGIHGAASYSWVIYTIHEGAMHRVLGRHLPEWVQAFLHRAPRLFFADETYYSKRHGSHHAYLGSLRDETNTHIVHPLRLLKSLLPGAGIFYRNDFHVASSSSPRIGNPTRFAVGGAFSILQIVLLRWALAPQVSGALAWIMATANLLLLSPWVGTSLDRIRDTYEHLYMPPDVDSGTRQIGMGPLRLLVAGGPWGQPYHLSHHLAPKLSWFSQIALARALAIELDEEQKYFYGVARRRGFVRTLLALLFANLKLLVLAKKVGAAKESQMLAACLSDATRLQEEIGIEVKISRWEELSGEEKSHVESLREKVYRESCSYLLSAPREVLDAYRDDDVEAYHCLAYSEGQLLAAMRLNRRPAESRYAPTAIQAYVNSCIGDAYYVSRLLRDSGLSKSRDALQVLFVKSGCHALSVLGAQGLYCFTKESLQSLYQKFGLEAEDQNTFAMKHRNPETRYAVMAGSRAQMIAASALSLRRLTRHLPVEAVSLKTVPAPSNKGAFHGNIRIPTFAKKPG